MPEIVNTSFIRNELIDATDNRETVIKVENVGMMFNIASEQLNNLKEYAIALARRQLYFKEFWALKDISFEIKKGDVFGIMGTNGSGKSTLLKILAGVLEPTKGSCRISGVIAPLIELGAGFDSELTARENVYLNGALLGYSKAFIEQHFDEIVDFAEVEEFLDMPIKNYSSGMVARIAFAIATVIIPDILIVDEVLSVGDFMFQQKCERKINSLIKDHGVTVLIVSHSNDQIARLCNRAIWIEKGHMRMLGSAEDVCQTYSLVGGREGSAESEALILETLDLPQTKSIMPFKVLSSEDQVGLVSKLYPTHSKSHNTLLMTLVEDLSGTILTSSLSSLFASHLLATRKAYLPDLTIQALSYVKPDQLTFIKTGDTEYGSEEIYSTVNPAPKQVDEIIQPTYEQGSIDIYHYGCAHGTWGNTALLSVFDNTATLNSFSSYAYQNKIPVFYAEKQAPLLSNELKDILVSDFSRVLVVADEANIPEQALTALRESGLDVLRFAEQTPYLTNQRFTQWLDETEKIESCNHAVVITSALFPQDGTYIGAFAAQHNAIILLEDSYNLDSVASAVSYLQSNKDHISEVFVVGEKGRYSELDLTLLKKALA